MAMDGSPKLKGSNIVLAPESLMASALKTFPDSPKADGGSHNALYLDSIGTPTTLTSKYHTPARPDKIRGSDDTSEFQWRILKSVHDLQVVQKQQQESMEALRKSLSGSNYVNTFQAARILKVINDMQTVQKQGHESMEMLQKDMTESLHEQMSASSMLEKMRELTGVLEEQSRRPLEFTSVFEELKSVEGRITKQMKQMMEEMRTVRRQQEQAEKGTLLQIHEEIFNVRLVPEVKDAVRRSEMQIGDVLKFAESVSADSTRTSRDVKEIQGHHTRMIQDVDMLLKESKQHYADFVPCLQDQLTTYLQKKPVNVNLEEVLTSMSKTRNGMALGFDQVLNEIARVQQALNVDFARVIDDVTDNMRKSLADIGGRQSTHIDIARGQTMPFSKVQTDDEFGAAKSLPVALMMTKSQTEVKSRGSTDSNTHAASGSKARAKRFRNFMTQTEPHLAEDAWVQTDDEMWKAAMKPKKKKEQQPQSSGKKKGKGPAGRRTAFQDADAVKRQMRNQLMQPQYDVTDYYWETGCSQFIATHPIFENFTLFVTLVNVIWIGVDADHNDAAMLIDAHPVFQVAENFFCTYFTFEVVVRFLSFQHKKYCLRDFWFVFDSLLVFLMVAETWIISIVMLAMENRPSGGFGGLSILRIFRFAKVVRVSRLAKLLRAIPEIVILLKGIKFAVRSVIVFLMLWSVIIFVFAIVFRQMNDDDDVGRRYFSSVPTSMNTLLLNGLLPENEPIVNDVTSASWVNWILMMAFIILASLTLMHMLMGVLVETIAIISMVEKEGMAVTYVSSSLRSILESLDHDPDSVLTKAQFQKLIMEPAVARLFRSENVDTNVLIDMAEIIFQDLETTGVGGLSFEMLVETVLNMRGSNPATVKDVKEQLRLIKSVMRDSLTLMHSSIHQDMEQLKIDITAAVEAHAPGDTHSEDSHDSKDRFTPEEKIDLGGESRENSRLE